MVYRILADITVIAHFAYVMFVIVGLIVTLVGGALNWRWVRNRWFRGVHLLMIGIVVVEAWLGIVCPLTTLEKNLRARAGEESYQGDFVANWFHEILFFEADAWVFTVAYTLFGALVLGTILMIPPQWRVSESRQP